MFRSPKRTWSWYFYKTFYKTGSFSPLTHSTLQSLRCWFYLSIREPTVNNNKLGASISLKQPCIA